MDECNHLGTEAIAARRHMHGRYGHTNLEATGGKLGFTTGVLLQRRAQRQDVDIAGLVPRFVICIEKLEPRLPAVLAVPGVQSQ